MEATVLRSETLPEDFRLEGKGWSLAPVESERVCLPEEISRRSDSLLDNLAGETGINK